MNLGIYAENILEHYKNPLNRGILQNADTKAYEVNPLCGDELEVSLKINGDHIIDAKFNGNGCAISQASADILIETIKGKSLEFDGKNS